MLAIAAYFDLDINQIDVKVAFWYKLINQLVYIDISKGSELEATWKMVNKLLKDLYSLGQSLSLCYERLSDLFLQKRDLVKFNIDHRFYISVIGLDKPVLSIFLDNIKIMTSKESGHISWVQAEFATAFFIVDMKTISFYLGLKINYNWENQKIKLSQSAYINKVLNCFPLKKAKTMIMLMKDSTIL